MCLLFLSFALLYHPGGLGFRHPCTIYVRLSSLPPSSVGWIERWLPVLSSVTQWGALAHQSMEDRGHQSMEDVMVELALEFRV